jgi:alginate O-acetyltransferase complex protein AlgJ
MKRRASRYSRWLFCTFLSGAISIQFAYAADQTQGIAGKNEWLFYTVEFTAAADKPAADTSIDMIRRFNKVLARNGIVMAFTMVPLKARIYAEYLRDDARLNPYMLGNYDRMAQALRAGQVNVIDLNGPFLNSPQRNSDTPLFFRLDTHWSPAGALLAAEAIRAGIDANPALQKTLGAIPEEKFVMNWGKLKVNTPTRDLVAKLSEGAPGFAAEQVLPFQVSREQKVSGSLLGDDAVAAITLMGSSYSAQHYRLPDALRYTLQRDLLAISVEAIQGSWVGMESYLRDDSFQTSKPKLLIWEMPERDMSKPPDFKFREDRYQSDNTEWLLRAAAWVQGSCTPSPVAAKMVAGGLLTNATDNVTAGKTTDQDFIELNFNKPFGKLDYLAASVATNGSKKLVLEASGAGVETRWFDVPVPGNGAEHVFKSPLPSDGKGFTKLRIYPGKSSAFVFKGLQVCRQPEDLLK